MFLEIFLIFQLRHLGSQLAEMERAIDNLMEADFLNVTCNDLEKRIAELERVESPDGIDTEVGGTLF